MAQEPQMDADTRRWSDADRDYVAQCLGRVPKCVVGVAARDTHGQPAVIINHPFAQDGQRWLPFPTLYWLVDPQLSARIAEVERKGGVREIETAMQTDDALMQSHLADNTSYAKERMAYLAGEEKSLADKQGFFDVLETSGIGGVANHASVKCLHAQYAYHLAKYDTPGISGTTVGRLMEERYGIRFTP